VIARNRQHQGRHSSRIARLHLGAIFDQQAGYKRSISTPVYKISNGLMLRPLPRELWQYLQMSVYPFLAA
jgi:hypothetical protein